MTRIRNEAECCERFAGHHYASKRFKRSADRFGWNSLWPIIDARGRLTGKIADSDTRGMANVGDMAMVALADLPAEERKRIRDMGDQWDGYADGIPHLR